MPRFAILTSAIRSRITVVFLAGLAVAGCEPAAAPAGPPPPEVTTITVAPADVPVTYEYVGQAAGFREVEVRARVTGILLRRNYTEGEPVARGRSLFLIDPAPFQAALSRAEADLAVAAARHDQAARDVARLKPVYEAKAVSQKEFDDTLSAEQVAAAEVKAAQARVDEARLNLGYTRVAAPIAGVASRALPSEGSLISGPDVLLTTVTQTDPMYVIFGIPDREHLAMRREIESGRLKLPADGKFSVVVKLSDGDRYAHAGQLNFTDVRVDTQTGTTEARAVMPNPDGLLRAGEFVRVLMNGATRPAAITVPQRPLVEGPEGKFVYVVGADDKAASRPVEVGPWNGDDWVITAGLAAGDRVIVDGVLKVFPGAPVQVAAAAAPPGGPPDAAPAAPPAEAPKKEKE
ncbi:MAG TPA: efflux RND transporter periplasmic adaptor subunit [Acidiferrobacterales bacterium]